MPISIACPHCDWKGRVKDELAGKTGKCPTCGELFPIPKKGAPPAISAGRKPVDDEPDVVDDADIVEDEPRSRSKPGGRPAPASKGRRVEDDRPSKSRRRAVDDDEDRPSKARRRAVEDDAEEDRPRKKRRVADDDDYDDDDRPRKKKRAGGRARRRRGGGSNGKKMATIIGGCIFLVIGLALLAFNLLVLEKPRLIWPALVIISAIVSIIQGFTQSGSDGGDEDDD